MLALLCPVLRAAAPSAGSLEGRVANSATGDYVERARVTIELKQFFRDRNSALWNFAFPVILLVIFGSVFGGQDIAPGITFAQYDVGKDGRFLMIKRATEAGRLNVVLNWTSELAKLTQSR